MRLFHATRPASPHATSDVKRFVRWGAGPRASQQLIFASKVRAALLGRFHVEIEDIRALATPILRHRILLNYHAEAERLSTDTLIGKVVAEVK